MSLTVTSWVNYLLTILNSPNPVISDYPCCISPRWPYTTFSVAELSNVFPHHFRSRLSRCHLCIHLRNLVPVNPSSNCMSTAQIYLLWPDNSSKSYCFSSFLEQPCLDTENHYIDSSYLRELSNENSTNNMCTHFMEDLKWEFWMKDFSGSLNLGPDCTS